MTDFFGKTDFPFVRFLAWHQAFDDTFRGSCCNRHFLRRQWKWFYGLQYNRMLFFTLEAVGTQIFLPSILHKTRTSVRHFDRPLILIKQQWKTFAFSSANKDKEKKFIKCSFTIILRELWKVFKIIDFPVVLKIYFFAVPAKYFKFQNWNIVSISACVFTIIYIKHQWKVKNNKHVFINILSFLLFFLI